MSAPALSRTPLGATLTFADLRADPFGVLARLREQEPVSWIAAEETWLVTSHELVDEAHRDQVRFVTDFEGSEVRRLFGTTMLTVDGEAHRVHHQPFAAPLGRRACERDHATLVRALAERAVAAMGDGSAELVSQLARPMALQLVSTVVGFEDSDTSELERLVSDMAAADGIGVGDAVRLRAAATRERFSASVRDALAQAPAQRPQSLLAAVARTRSPQLSDQHVIDNTINMIFGAVDPTAILIGTAIWALLAHPQALARVRSDRSLLPLAVAEAARWHPPFAASVRYAGADTTFAGVDIRAGEKVYLMILAANRDERAFRDPDVYDIDRADLRASVAFGRGIHHCIGEALSAMAAREALDVALSELPELRLDPRRPCEPRGIDHHQLERLDVLFGERA